MGLFEFRRKIGAAELAAVAALVLAGVVFYRTTFRSPYLDERPNLIITRVSWQPERHGGSSPGFTYVHMENGGQRAMSSVTLAFPLHQSGRPERMQVRVDPEYECRFTMTRDMAYATITGPLGPGKRFTVFVTDGPTAFTVHDEYGSGYAIRDGKVHMKI
jgi:hypothetical protein